MSRSATMQTRPISKRLWELADHPQPGGTSAVLPGTNSAQTDRSNRD